MFNAKLRRLAPWLALALFAGALWLLHHRLRHYRYHDVMIALAAIPGTKLLIAGLLASASYVILSGYDGLALTYIGRTLRYARILFVSFTGCVLGYNVGFSVLGGTAVRYRLYTSWGLSPRDVARIVAFTSVTFWAGFCALAGSLFLTGMIALPTKVAAPFGSMRAIGAVLVVIVAAYAFACLRLQRPLTIYGWKFRLPAPRLALAQVVLGAIDLAVAGSILFVLLPAGRIGILEFLGLYLLAMIAGLVSHVPAGIGVFETVILYGLRGTVPAAPALGALLAYRVVYYLVPLGCALGLLAGHELWRRQKAVRGAATDLRRWLAQIAPPLIATSVFVGGVMLLFSGATPGVHDRLFWLRRFLPLPVLELSHFAGSLIGVGLIFLARGLQRRIDAAYGLTLALLASGVVVSLLKGLDFEEASLLALMFGALLPCRGYFDRRASLLAERLTGGWLLAVALAVGATVWLGLFSYRHVEYANDLWWQFSFGDNAPRFLRALVGVFTALLGLALARLLRPAPPAHVQPTDEDIATAGSIAAESPETHAYLALLRDKSLLLSASGASFLMYAVERRSWIAMGDPVGDEGEFPELLRRFRERADAHGGWAVIYQAGARHLPLYLECGFALVKIGEEARVYLDDFTIEGAARKGLRHAAHRAQREGCSFAVVPPAELARLLPELRGISTAWLAHRNTREKGFSLGRFTEDYVRRFPVAVVRCGERIVAFANVWCGGRREELSVDLMRFRPDAPPGVMDYLFVELMRWGAREGYAWFNLGMAPLSGIEPDALAPIWIRIGAFVFRHGEHFYHFRGLRAYKEKFAPEWRPRYIASPGRLALPAVVANVAALISGGLKGVVVK
jgi:phosphatidylglycerol lysyltransferase